MAWCTTVCSISPFIYIILIHLDLLGVPDPIVWTCNHSLRQLTKARGYNHIKFAQLKDLHGISTLREEMNDMTHALMHRYGNLNGDSGYNESYVSNDQNKRLTYCRYLELLSLAITPWHGVVAVIVDETILAGQHMIFEQDANMELVYEDGRPSYFRERLKLYQWDCSPSVTFEPLYPCGILIRPSANVNALAIEQMDAQKVCELAQRNSPIVLRGFTNTRNRNAFLAKSYELGIPTPWKFGLILEDKDHGTAGQGLNNVLSQEWMPFHFDGMFKT
jgi:hypothetical protein